MPLPVLPAVAIGVGALSKVAGIFSGNKAERDRAKLLEQNALVRLTAQLSGLATRQRQELISAAQARRQGRRQTVVQAARAKAAGASRGVGSATQVQDVFQGGQEFLGSINLQLREVRRQLETQRRAARSEFSSALQAARAGQGGGPLQDLLDFSSIALDTANAFAALPKPRGG